MLMAICAVEGRAPYSSTRAVEVAGNEKKDIQERLQIMSNAMRATKYKQLAGNERSSPL